jgi:argonaute-like protein implicated in RNA metabolism and viral defense
MISAFLYFIRNKINPLPIQNYNSSADIPFATNSSTSSKKEDISIPIPSINTSQKEEEKKTDDLPQRVQHNICNLVGLDIDELAYVEEMNCKHMFEIVKLLNKTIISFVDGIMEID